jgi:hypothetical protein
MAVGRSRSASRLLQVRSRDGQLSSLLLIGMSPWAEHSLHIGAFVGGVLTDQHFAERIKAVAKGAGQSLFRFRTLCWE